MSVKEILLNIPFWYLAITIVFAFYYAIRGVMEKVMNQKLSNSSWSKTQKIVIDYIQEFIFKIVVTLSGFFSLFVGSYISSSIKSIEAISVGTAALLIFLFVWGIIGVSGYLTWLIVTGKFPGSK